MPYRFESHGSDKAMRCAVCEGKFGSSGIIRCERRFAPASASIASRRAAKVGIFEDAADFASHCQDHDGPLIAAQLKALADDYERRADKASRR